MSYSYNLTKSAITDLREVDDNNSTTYYRYNDIDFYYKKYDSSDRLLVAFHGHRGSASIPIFRSYNWNYNVLSISDKLLELYPTVGLGWFLSTPTLALKDKYIAILQYFVSKYQNVIFYGSSGGGFPALLYASYFHKKCFAQSAQLYLDKYQYIYQVDNEHLTKLIHVLNTTRSELGETNAEEIIEHYGLPQYACIYCNERDERHYNVHFNRFKEYIQHKKLEAKYTFRSFTYDDDPANPITDHHTIGIPPGTSIYSLINELFAHDN